VDYENDEAMKALYASASHDYSTGDLILKVVNASSEKIDTAVHLKGANEMARKGQAIVLTSGKPTDENSLDAPQKVSPKMQTFNLSGPNFHHDFPANSLTILRIGPPKKSL